MQDKQVPFWNHCLTDVNLCHFYGEVPWHDCQDDLCWYSVYTANRDKYSPKAYSLDNNMHPGPVPQELLVRFHNLNLPSVILISAYLLGMTHVEEMLISVVKPIYKLLHGQYACTKTTSKDGTLQHFSIVDHYMGRPDTPYFNNMKLWSLPGSIPCLTPSELSQLAGADV